MGCLCAVWVAPAWAQAPSGNGSQLSADEVVHRLNSRDDGEFLSQVLLMELIDRSGSRRERETRTLRRYYGREKRILIFYESPKNVEGTGFLTFDYPEPERSDDQWLYLPALRKVRRISASDRGSYFLGTDFTYEDVKKAGKLEVSDYHFELKEREQVDGQDCYVVDAVPVSEDVKEELGYGRVRLWVDHEIWMQRKAKMWDVRDNPLKTVLTRDIREVDGIWTAHRLEAENHKTGHRSIFTFRDTDYETAIPDDVFTQSTLRRGL